MDRTTQAGILKQASSMCTFALETPAMFDSANTERDLKGYQVSLTLVKLEEFRTIRDQASVLVRATLKYLRQRTEQNLQNAHYHRDKLTDMVTEYLDEGR